MQPRKVTAGDMSVYPNSQLLVYEPPKDMPNCLALETLTIDGAATSFWVPTKEELHLLLEGGSIELTVIGGFMPPVAVGVATHG